MENWLSAPSAGKPPPREIFVTNPRKPASAVLNNKEKGGLKKRKILRLSRPPEPQTNNNLNYPNLL
jgi:hypothetical protein